MLLKIIKSALFPVLLVCSAGVIQAAGITHVLGAKKSLLAPASDTVNAGYYSSTTLSAVDTDLIPWNLRSGVVVFGKTGTFTSTATAVVGDILSGKTAGVAGNIITGTMPTQTLSVANDTVTAGYYAGTTLSAVDSDLIPWNLRRGVVVFGKTGTFTSTATAVVGDILSGKTAGVAGNIITGTMATQTLNVANDTVSAGYYSATTLSAVDTDLAAGNIAVGKTIFGFGGTYTSDANAAAANILNGQTAYVNGVKITGNVPAGSSVSGGNGVKTFTIPDGLYSGSKTATANDALLVAGNIKSGIAIFGITGTYTNPPPTPGVGGTWLLVPGDSSLGTRDFYVMKYEAKDVGGVPTSQAAGTPWVSIIQSLAETKCMALGAGYHLLTMDEAQTISRNIESIGWNWTGGSVGSGGLWRGHTDNAPPNTLEADITADPDDDPYTGTGNIAPSIEKRVYQLSSGQYIWDWSGNVWEWLHMTCAGGAGVGLWETTGWLEWSNAALADYEKGRAGPAGSYSSAQNAGQYYGCTATANPVLRGSNYNAGVYGGLFTILANQLPSYSADSVGFRCSR